MKILSNQSELPIYAQIKEQIIEQILNGEIAEGEVLPSIQWQKKSGKCYYDYSLTMI